MTKIPKLNLSNSEKLSIIGNMTTMLSSGIPLFESVESLIEDANGNPKKFLGVLRDDLSSGNHIYVTLSKFPGSFDHVTVNVIKASEEAGSLETALTDLAANIKKEMEFEGKIKSAMIYPLIIMLVFLGVMLLILVVVMPKISQVFMRLKMDLPLPTRVMIFMSETLTKNPLPVVGGIVLLLSILVLIFKTQRRVVMPIIYRLPLISQLVKEIDLTRFARNLFLLLTAGLPITTALDLAKDVVMREKTKEVIINSRGMIMAGKKLAEGLAGAKGEIPATMLKLIEVGEKSGSLPKAMFDISEFMDYKVSETLKNLTVLLEPLMLVVVGVFVGGMMLAIIAPIYGLISQVGGR